MQKRPNPENYTFKVTWFCRKQKHIYEILFDILTLGYISSKITDWKLFNLFFTSASNFQPKLGTPHWSRSKMKFVHKVYGGKNSCVKSMGKN